MKRPVPIELPHVVSVRLSDDDLRRLVALVHAGRRNVSQTLRILLETALRDAAQTP